MNGNMMLHCGAHEATEDQVFRAPTPPSTETHFPIPHQTLISTVAEHIGGSGFEIERREYGLMADGEQMFAVWALRGGVAMSDYQLTVGLRNSHDKTFSAGMAVGSRVFVCDNLAFSAEIVIARKHTRFILRDLDRMVAEACGRIGEARIQQDRRIEAYKGTEMDDPQVHDLLIRAVDARVMANSYIAKVLKEWREPRHEEFEPRTAWSLFNGFTEVFKGTNPRDLTPRTTRLHGLMDLETDAFGVEVATPDFEAPVPGVALVGPIMEIETPTFIQPHLN